MCGVAEVEGLHGGPPLEHGDPTHVERGRDIYREQEREGGREGETVSNCVS